MAALPFLRRLPSSRWAFQQMRFVGSVVHDPACEDFTVKNEPILGYLNGSPERDALDASLKTFGGQEVEIPIVIAGERLKTGEKRYVTCPFEHKKKLAHFYRADPFHVQKAIDSAMRARGAWEATPLKDRIDIFLKAANLCAGKYRADLNAATMLGQGKTIFQAEIDSAAELVDFLRFNAFWCKELVKQSVPLSPNPSEVRNHLRYRGLEGFIASISPFNFTAIGGNLGASPALMGNVILWKPSETALLSNWIIFQILEEAGMPPGVVNFVPAEGPFFGKVITDSQHLAAVNFTGSVATWRWIVRAVGSKIDLYTNFPRLIGETGGKNFHLIHPSADLETVVASTIRSAFEYGGQKCSACSRLYVPHSVWPKMREMMLAKMKEVKIGDARDPSVFFSAVIDKPSFTRIKGYLKYAKQQHRIIHGGKYDDSKGWYIEPTIVEVDNHKDKLLQEEIFGPVLSVHEFPDKLLEKDIFELIGKHSFGLTGAVYAQDEAYLKKALEGLKFSCGNFYINDKSTGAVVGQQPFGGSRLSGTNDKAGGIHYMLRFANPQTVKETFIPMPDVRYPYMKE